MGSEGRFNPGVAEGIRVQVKWYDKHAAERLFPVSTVIQRAESRLERPRLRFPELFFRKKVDERPPSQENPLYPQPNISSSVAVLERTSQQPVKQKNKSGWEFWDNYGEPAIGGVSMGTLAGTGAGIALHILFGLGLSAITIGAGIVVGIPIAIAFGLYLRHKNKQPA